MVLTLPAVESVTPELARMKDAKSSHPMTDGVATPSEIFMPAGPFA